MNAIVLAGGNSTRLAGELGGKTKILYPLGGSKTMLSNIFDQLDGSGVDKIIVRPADKREIIEYVSQIALTYNTKIEIDEKAWPSPSHYLTDSMQHLPATFILGDTYFPEGELRRYIKAAIGSEVKYDGFIGVSKEHVGDARVVIDGDLITDLSHNFTEGYYACGLFTIYKPEVFSKLEHQDKYAHTWALLPKNGYRLGYHMVGDGVLDLDTPEELHKLLEALGKS